MALFCSTDCSSLSHACLPRLAKIESGRPSHHSIATRQQPIYFRKPIFLSTAQQLWSSQPCFRWYWATRHYFVSISVGHWWQRSGTPIVRDPSAVHGFSHRWKVDFWTTACYESLGHCYLFVLCFNLCWWNEKRLQNIRPFWEISPADTLILSCYVAISAEEIRKDFEMVHSSSLHWQNEGSL